MAMPRPSCATIAVMTSHHPPSLWKSLGEARAAFEWGTSFLPSSSPPAGDGHPVLLLPGFLTADLAMAPLRHRLEHWGYDARPWELGVNTGPRPGTLDAIVRRVRALHAETGRSVTLLGWSLGGSLAVVAARRLKKEVRGLITLGSPVRAAVGISRASGLFTVVSGSAPDSTSFQRWLATPSQHPWTAIVSRHDGVVAGDACAAPPGRRRETVWVPATHLGLPANPCVRHVIAERLAQKPETWKPFSLEGAPWPLRAAWMLA